MCTLRNWIFFTLFLAVSLVSRADDLEPLYFTVDYPSSPVVLGSGWDISENSGRFQSCIDFQESVFSSFQDIYSQMNIAEDHDALSKALNVSASAKYNGVFSNFNASASFVKETKFLSRSTYVAVSAEVREAPIFVGPLETTPSPGIADSIKSYLNRVQLKKPFEELAMKDIREFRRQCGDGFVSVITSGAKINGILEFKKTTKEDSESISTMVSGSGGGVSFSAELRTKIKEFSDSRRFSIRYLGLGGAPAEIPLNVDSLLNVVRTLPASSKSSPRPFEVYVHRYDQLPNFPSVVMHNELTDLEVLAEAYWRLFTLRGYVDEAIYDGDDWLLTLDATREALLPLQTEVLEKLDQLRTQIAECTNLGSEMCSSGDWDEWSDLDVRSRLPLNGSWEDVRVTSEDNQIKDIAIKLANLRVEKWIEPVVRLRCENGEQCTSAREVDEIKENIVSRILASVQ